MCLPDPPVLVISDRSQARRPLIEVAEAAFAGGCRWFSLREKDLPAGERRALLVALVELGHRFGAVVTAHEDIDAAIAAGADGVHLPGGGDPRAARARLPGGLIGASAHSAAEAAALLRAGADYVTVSPVFPTASKPGYGPAIGLDGLARTVAAAPAPVVALGGITPDNAALCRAAGAGGIAVMGEVMRADDPQATVARLIRAFSRESRGLAGASPRPFIGGALAANLCREARVGPGMGNINASVDLRRDGNVAEGSGVAVVTVDNPPVNALKHEVRAGLAEALRQARDDASVEAVVIACAGRTFFAGADITEFGKPPQAPGLGEVIAQIEAMPKPVVAALHGTALGGGFEVALACHFRVAVADGARRPARGQARPVARRRRDAAPAAPRRPRKGAADDRHRRPDRRRRGRTPTASSTRSSTGDLTTAAIAFARRVVAERRPLATGRATATTSSRRRAPIPKPLTMRPRR